MEVKAKTYYGLRTMAKKIKFWTGENKVKELVKLINGVMEVTVIDKRREHEKWNI